MDHIVLPARCLPLPRKRSPDAVTTDCGCRHLHCCNCSLL